MSRMYLGPDDHSLKVPPGLLAPGRNYYLRLTAQTAPGANPERVWFTLVVPFSSATTSSALLSVQ
ncbi:hypothetical protein POL68_13435 [Stigmatella sp. ncwal1]|uniref:Uncharacterized protein n=1 Tax=Stigmatella ashevillensis TaxID=2995309 RepID=A0ABT5D8L1_9BACT|nr:hypothetical protein [Stigmatella ashevillena]MDC0709468.1 hypothetical protein [Stigmatella ashevillena]